MSSARRRGQGYTLAEDPTSDVPGTPAVVPGGSQPVRFRPAHSFEKGRWTVEEQNPQTEVRKEVTPNLFIGTLTDMDKSGVLDELEHELRNLVSTVLETRKKGTLTLKLRVDMRTKNADCHEVEIGYEVKVDPPKFDSPATVFFARRTGDLSRQDFEQGKLFDLKPSEPAT